MSGGVDSSVTAALLKKQGYDVVGLFLVMGNNQKSKDAEKVTKKLNIPLEILDVRKEFKKSVVDYLINEYKKGKTPNPCVECNKYIKFRFLLKKMMGLKADFIATGHYARINKGKLFKGVDKSKDQSYFLWTLAQKKLSKILFPIGDYTKKEVRTMAKKWNLPVHEKKESQEICFIPDGNIRKFLKKALPAEALAKAGPIITTKGEKIGKHEGLAYYTIGQRRGIKIGGVGPFYVVDKDFKENALIVAQSDFNEALFKKEMIVKNVNWISKVKLPLKCNVKIRYLTPAVPATISKQRTMNNEQLRAVFDKKQRAITPGQSAVFYKRNEVLGGGIIC